MAQASEQLAQYGKALEQYGGVTENEPAITLNFGDFADAVEKILNRDDEALLTGFLSIIPGYVFKNWNTFTAAQKAALKSDLIRVCNKNYSTHMAQQLSHFVSQVLRYCDGEWPEIYSFVMNESSSNEINGYILCRLMQYGNADFFNQDQTKVLDKVLQLAKSVTYECKLCLLRSITFLKICNDFIPYMNQFIDLCIRCMTENPVDYHILYRIIVDKFKETESFQITAIPPTIGDEHLFSVIYLMGLFDSNLLLETLEKAILYVAQQSTNLPIKLYDILTKSAQLKINPYIKSNAVNLFKKYIDTDKFAATVFVLSPFSSAYAQSFEDITALGTTYFVDYANSSPYEQKIWCLSLKSLISSFSMYTFPDTLIPSALKLFGSNDKELLDLVTDCFSVFIRHGLIALSDDFSQIFNTFKTLNNIQKVKLFSAFEVLLRKGGFDGQLIQPLVDFIRSTFHTASDNGLIAECFNLIFELGNIDSNIASSFTKEMLNSLTTIINEGKNEFIGPAAKLLAMYSSIQPTIVRRPLTNLFPKLLAFCKSSSNLSETRSTVGESVAGLVEAFFKKKELPNVVPIITTYLRSADPILIKAGAQMVNILSKLIEKQSSSIIFSHLARCGLHAADEDVFNVVVEAMKRIVKTAILNKNIAIRFAYNILCENQTLFLKQPITHWLSLKSPLYNFITIVIEKNPKDVDALVPQLDSLINHCIDEMFTMIFDSYAAAYGVGLVKDLPSAKLYEICYKETFTQRSFVSLSYVLDRITDQAENFTIRLAEEWLSITEKDAWRCAIGDAIMQMCAKQQIVDLTIIEDILKAYPFKADYNFTETLSQSIIKAFEQNEFLQPVEIEVVKAFADLFLMEKSDFLSYHIDYETQMEMKTTMRRIMKNNKAYEKEMQKHFQGNRNKYTKFLSLIQ